MCACPQSRLGRFGSMRSLCSSSAAAGSTFGGSLNCSTSSGNRAWNSASTCLAMAVVAITRCEQMAHVVPPSRLS